MMTSIKLVRMPIANIGAALSLVGLVLGAGGSALAQGTGVLPGGPGAEPVQEVNQPPGPGPSPFEQTKLLGDPGGWRTRLDNMGIDLGLGYIAEFGGNVTGQNTGAGYAGQEALTLDVDWGKLADIPGFNTHFAAINRNGNNVSRTFGDHVSQVDEIYGAGFGVGFHLVYLYAEQKLLNDQINIAVGRLPIETDFATSTLYCIPVGLLYCGGPRATADQAQFTSWPQATWGGRVRVRPVKDVYLQFGAYESAPFPGGGRTGWSWSTNTATGAIMPVELGWEPHFGPNQLTGHYKIGFAYDTSDFNSLSQNAAGGPLLIPTETPALTSGRRQFWVTADQLLIRQGKTENAGLTLIGTYANSSGSNSVTWQTASAALLERGFWPSRPDDSIMLSGNWWGLSNQLSQLQEQQQSLGLPLANGALHPQHNEYGFELDYVMPIFRGVYIEPAVQYFLHPNADSHLKNALVFAGRLSVDF